MKLTGGRRELGDKAAHNERAVVAGDLRRPSKYRAKRTEYNGVLYASKAEANRAAELDLLLKAGNILDWIPQPMVRLGVPENVYRPDFLVIAQRGGVLGHGGDAWYEDVKGAETAKFKRDKKLWKAYGRLPLHVRGEHGCKRIIDPKGWKS
jgi:hypothetical protein